MDWRLILEFLVIVGALAMGARMGGVGLGLWGAVGLLVLVVGFDVAPANIPGEVLLMDTRTFHGSPPTRRRSSASRGSLRGSGRRASENPSGSLTLP